MCNKRVRLAVYLTGAFLALMLLTAQSCGESADSVDSGEVTGEKWKQVERGMTKEEVRSILGDADSVQTSDLDERLRFTEVWSWGGLGEYQISFDQRGVVTGKYKCRGLLGRNFVACRLAEGGD